MKRELKLTSDGSHTLYIAELDEHYHSVHGAIQESLHVFIAAGLVPKVGSKQDIKILEIGFGTGLNALLSLFEAEKFIQKIFYTAIEAFPLSLEEAIRLNYTERIGHPKAEVYYRSLHEADWESVVKLSSMFTLHKIATKLQDFDTVERFDLIYYDAFAPSAQPELWTIERFEQLFLFLNPRGNLVTYCAKGDVRRNMQKAGFTVEKLPGPPGKREMLRATKPIG